MATGAGSARGSASARHRGTPRSRRWSRLDLGAGIGFGADDGTRGDLVVEGLGAVTRFEPGVEQRVDGVLGRDAAEVRDQRPGQGSARRSASEPMDTT